MSRSRFQFSIPGLMALVLVVAVGAASLRYPTNLGANTLFTLDLMLLAMAVIGVLYRREKTRAFWAGFLIVGGTYLLLSFGPWFDTHVSPHLLSTALLDIIYPHLVTTSPGVEPPYPWQTWTRVEPYSGTRSSVGPFVMLSTDLFRRIGHSLIGLLAATGGGLLTRHLFVTRPERRREAAEKAVGIMVKVLEAGL